MAPVAPTHGPTALTSLAGNTTSAAASSSSPQFASPSLVARTQRWIEDNQRILLLGAAVATAGGIGWYLYNKPSSSSSRGKPGSGAAGAGAGDAGSAEGGASGAAKKKKNKKKKASGLKEGFLKGEGAEGPLLEEIPEAEREKVVPKEDDLFVGMSSASLDQRSVESARLLDCGWTGLSVCSAALLRAASWRVPGQGAKRFS